MDVDTRLAAIVADAVFLRERLDNRLTEAEPADDESVVEERLDRWRRAIGPVPSDCWERRLEWDGLDPATARSVLAGCGRPARALPPWAHVLAEICGCARSFAPEVLEHGPAEPDEPLAFEGLLLPAVAVARRMLRREIGLEPDGRSAPCQDVLSIGAYRALERGLLTRLCAVAGPTLDAEFRASLTYGHALLLALDIDPEPDSPMEDASYRTFVSTQLDDGMLDLFARHAVLGRLIATVVQLWVEATAELLVRLAADTDALVSTFSLSPGPFVSAEVSLSDPHRGGRSVVVLTAACGRKVLYKPKPLAMEQAFNALLDWCNRRGSLADLHVTTVLDRGDYGWVEHIAHLPCEDDAASQRFFVRAGMLLCLLTVVRATDCHHENVIAHGEHLVLVDAETLVAHDAEALDRWSSPEIGAASRQFGDSVLRTGLLPRWQFSGDAGAAFDVSGLGATGEEPRMLTMLRWHHTNTDAMRAVYESVPSEAQKNVANLDGRALSLYDHRSELADGFAQMYRFVMEHRSSLCAVDGPLAALRSVDVRFIFRATRVYGALTIAGYDPQTLGNGIDFGIHLEQLAMAYLAVPDKPDVWPVFAAEVRAMEQLDVPLFVARADHDMLMIDDGTSGRRTSVSGAIEQPGYDRMLDLIATMSESDLERQLALIEGALQAKAVQSSHGRIAAPGVQRLEDRRLSADDLRREATAIGAELERRAIADGAEGINWIGLGYLDHADRFQLQILDDNLYDGSPGVALFLAALSASTGADRFASLARRGLAESRRRLRAVDPPTRQRLARLRGVGAATGIGSTMYSLTRVGVLLRDAELIDDAIALSEWLTPDVIAGDTRLDVMAGAAGAILALLALHATTGSPDVLHKASLCGDHLLRHRIATGTGQRAWASPAGPALTGYSHGAAGIASALLRLYAVTRDEALFEAALEGFAFERSVYSPTHANWPDLRDAVGAGRPGFPVKWCHGAAGIALSRLCSRDVGDIEGIDAEIDVALETTRRAYVQDSDYLCCGNFGRVETFLVAHQKTGLPAWRDLADAGAARAVAQARRAGHYRLFVDVPGMYNPGFFQGMAGIGYQLLRLADDTLPSVLIGE